MATFTRISKKNFEKQEKEFEAMIECEEKYNPGSISVDGLLGSIKNKDIAIPEIQRPFVWKKTQVRDFLDSLYRGYPTGYLITWKSPNVRLKDGTMSSGKKILIDGQQRVTALMTAITGYDVIDSNYSKGRVRIAFNPFAAIDESSDSSIFEVQSSAISKDKRWIGDIAELFKPGFSTFKFDREYCAENPEMDEERLDEVIRKLLHIRALRIGVIDLADNLDIDVVTDIFIRINSKGTPLSQGGFVMSKIAADEEHGGNSLRKAIDYFAHLCVEPQHLSDIVSNDKEFTQTEYFNRLKWVASDFDSVYTPGCEDIIRVAFMTMYPRAKLADLVSLLSGRDFKERTYKSEIADETYEKLKTGVLKVISSDNFKNFILAIRSAGFISKGKYNHWCADTL